MAIVKKMIHYSHISGNLTYLRHASFAAITCFSYC